MAGDDLGWRPTGGVFTLRASLGPSDDLNAPILIDVQDEQVRATTDGAVLAVLLAIPGAEVDGNDDLLATGLTDVAGLVVQGIAGWAARRSDGPAIISERL